MAQPAEARLGPTLPIPWPDNAEIKTHTGGCHCRKVRYEFEHPDIYAMPVMNCNCSICEDREHLLVYILLSPLLSIQFGLALFLGLRIWRKRALADTATQIHPKTQVQVHERGGQANGVRVWAALLDMRDVDGPG
ncbi:hypothetical protein DFH08DRAFT_1016936 [Mycena albidolilacea]|uniref:Uncharacterized protein n=1 Tax=Mycena albidolilacea TaxID=1033008 RepID=A0AAD7APM8_9AGAR|nr:hypothetical protein DFH08DRAFT_1016936 [Mycena albidolilacea]